MEKYESSQYQIKRSAEQIWTILSDFRNLTPMIPPDKVEDWQADENSCSFRVQGMSVRLYIVDKDPFSYIKLGGDENSPAQFNLWIQLKEVEPYDTRMRLVLHVKLNMMMKMMLGSKISKGIDQMAEQIAKAFNGEL